MFTFKTLNTIHFIHSPGADSNNMTYNYISFNPDGSISSTIPNFPTKDTPSKALRIYFLHAIETVDAEVIALDMEGILRRTELVNQITRLQTEKNEDKLLRALQELRAEISGISPVSSLKDRFN